MEGDLHIAPGDFISGGYNFKFVDGSHGATAYSVTATVTVPVTCPDNTVENVVIHLGAPGKLDGGGVTTFKPVRWPDRKKPNGGRFQRHCRAESPCGTGRLAIPLP